MNTDDVADLKALDEALSEAEAILARMNRREIERMDQEGLRLMQQFSTKKPE